MKAVGDNARNVEEYLSAHSEQYGDTAFTAFTTLWPAAYLRLGCAAHLYSAESSRDLEVFAARCRQLYFVNLRPRLWLSLWVFR